MGLWQYTVIHYIQASKEASTQWKKGETSNCQSWRGDKGVGFMSLPAILSGQDNKTVEVLMSSMAWVKSCYSEN